MPDSQKQMVEQGLPGLGVGEWALCIMQTGFILG